MSYSYDKFLKPLTSTDVNIQILDNDGIIKFTIEPFSVINTMVNNNLLKVNVTNRIIQIPFSSITESKLALERFQLQLDDLRNRTNNLTNLEIKNYVDNYVAGYFSDNSLLKATGSYLIPKNDDKSIFAPNSYGIGILNDYVIDLSSEVTAPTTGNPYNSVKYTNNKFYISGYDDIHVLDSEFNLLQSFTSPVRGARISSVNEVGNKIYFASDNYPGTLFYINTLTDEIVWRGYGSPRGVLWNASYMGATSGWLDLSDVESRSYTSFPGALDYTPPNSIGEEMVMWDTINNKYHTFMFSTWQSGGGGAIAYDRREILSITPSVVLGPTVSFSKPSFGTQSDLIDTNVELTRGNNQGLFNLAYEASYTNSYSYNIKYNPVNNKVYNYDYDNDILVIMTDDLVWETDISPTASINPWSNGNSIGVNTTNGDVYLVDSYGTILAYDINNVKVVDIDPVTPFNNNGDDLIGYNPVNDTIYVSDRYNTIYMIDGTSRTLSGSLDLTLVTTDVQYLKSIEYSSGEIILSGTNNLSEGIIIKIDNSNTITVLGNTELNRTLPNSINDTIKVNGQYSYIIGNSASYYLTVDPFTVQYENKIIGGSASSNRTHQLQDADGIIAHLSDIPPAVTPGIPGVYVNKTVYVDAQYGSDSTGQVDVMDKPFLTIGAAYSALQSILFGANQGTVHVRSGIYNSVGVIFLISGKYVNFYFEPGCDIRNASFTDWAQTGQVECKITGYATFQNTSNIGYSLLEFGYHNSKVSFKARDIIAQLPGSGVFGAETRFPTYVSSNRIYMDIEVDEIRYTHTTSGDVNGQPFNFRAGSNVNLKVKNMIINSSSITFRHRSSFNYPSLYNINIDIDNLTLYPTATSVWSSNLFIIENTSPDAVFNYNIKRFVVDSMSSPSYAWLSIMNVLGTGGTINYNGNILMKGTESQNPIIYMFDSLTYGSTFFSFNGKVNNTLTKGSASPLIINSLRDSDLQISGQISCIGDPITAQSSLLLTNNQSRTSFIDFVSETINVSGGNPIIKVNDTSALIAYNSMFKDLNATSVVKSDNTFDYVYLGNVISNLPAGVTLDSSSSLFIQDPKLNRVPKINV